MYFYSIDIEVTLISISSEVPKYLVLQMKLCAEKIHTNFKDLKNISQSEVKNI